MSVRPRATRVESRMMNDRTRSLRSLEGVGTTATARHRARLVVSSVTTEQPTLVLVRQGRKQIKRGALNIRVEAGDAVVVPPGQAFDLITTPEGGEFVSTMLIPAQPIIDEVAAMFVDVPTLRRASALKAIEPELLASFERAVHAVSEPAHVPRKVTENRMREILIWLAHRGLKLGRERDPNLTRRIRALLSQDPSRDWKAGEMARAVAMSEATLRRHLREEGVSFQEILIDVRMSRALALLQVTDLPIGQVALEVGYDSASRFAVRFRRRFAMSPSVVRGGLEA